MPLYDYHCSHCGHRDELLLPVKKSQRLQKCPGCARVALKRQFPSRIVLRTETTFLSRRQLFGDQFANDAARDRVVEAARANGHEPKANEHYQRGLARFQGDPLAFVPHDNTKSYMRTVLTAQNRSCLELGVEAPETEPKPRPRLAEDIVQEHLANRVAEDPGLAEKPNKLREARAEILDKYGAPAGA